MLDGSMADLGTGMDVLFQGAEEDVISFELRGSDVSPCRLSFAYSRTSDNLKSSGSVELPELWRTMPPFGGGLFYVSADRTGPARNPTHNPNRSRNAATWGPEVNTRSTTCIRMRMNHWRRTIPDAKITLPGYSVTWWSTGFQEISPGVHLELESVRSADALVSGFSFDQKGRCSHTSVPGDERGLRPLVYPSRADFNAGATRDSVPHREPRGAPTFRKGRPGWRSWPFALQ